MEELIDKRINEFIDWLLQLPYQIYETEEIYNYYAQAPENALCYSFKEFYGNKYLTLAYKDTLITNLSGERLVNEPKLLDDAKKAVMLYLKYHYITTN